MKHAGVRQTAGKSPHGTHAYGRATHPDHRLPCPSAVCLLHGATRRGMSTGAGRPTWPALWSLCCATPPVLPLLAPPGMPAPVVRDEEPSSDTLGLAHGRRRSAAAALSRVHLCLCWLADLVSGGVRCQRPWKALHEGISIIQGPCLHRAHTILSYTACTNAYGQAGAPDHEHQAPSTKLHRPRNAHEGMSPVQHAAWGRGMQREPPSWQWLAAQASICCLSLLQPQSLAGCQSLQQQHLLLRLLVSPPTLSTMPLRPPPLPLHHEHVYQTQRCLHPCHCHISNIAHWHSSGVPWTGTGFRTATRPPIPKDTRAQGGRPCVTFSASAALPGTSPAHTPRTHGLYKHGG